MEKCLSEERVLEYSVMQPDHLDSTKKCQISFYLRGGLKPCWVMYIKRSGVRFATLTLLVTVTIFFTLKRNP